MSTAASTPWARDFACSSMRSEALARSIGYRCDGEVPPAPLGSIARSIIHTRADDKNDNDPAAGAGSSIEASLRC